MKIIYHDFQEKCEQRAYSRELFPSKTTRQNSYEIINIHVHDTCNIMSSKQIHVYALNINLYPCTLEILAMKSKGSLLWVHLYNLSKADS